MDETKNKSLITGGIIAAVVVLIIAIFVGQYTGAVAYGAKTENDIKATYANNQNILGQYTTKIGEMAQVPAMQRNDLMKVLEAAFSSRYGESGSQASMQWIKEAYPGTLSNALYENLQAEMASGRTEFQSNQTRLIDQKAKYETNLAYVFKGFWLKMAGYPKVNLDDYKVVVSSSARQSFETGIDDGVKLPGAQ